MDCEKYSEFSSMHSKLAVASEDSRSKCEPDLEHADF